MKLSFLILFFLVLSGAGGSAGQNIKSKEIRPDKHEASPDDVQTAAEKQLQEPTPFETGILKAIRAIADQQKAAKEQNDASQKSWNSLSVFINIGLLIAAAIYTCFAWKQWQAIRRQADIAADGVRVAQASADAALASARAADASLHIYRPFIVVRKPFTNSVKADSPLRRRMPTAVHIKVCNYGIGPADIVRYFVSSEVFHWAGDDPPLPIYSENEVCHTINSVIKPDGEIELVPLWFDISQDDFSEMLNDTKRLAFHGIIYYRGGPEKIYWTRFFWWCILSAGEEIVRPKSPELNAHT